MKASNSREDAGFVGLFRSDHFTNSNPPDLESLELWTSLTWLASNTERIEFGPLVTPFSFRHPAFTARMAAALDDLSSGRLTLGMGAGFAFYKSLVVSIVAAKLTCVNRTDIQLAAE